MDSDSHALWDRCPLPLYKLDPSGRPLALNAAMTVLMGGVVEIGSLPVPMRLPGGSWESCRRLWRSSEGVGRVLIASERCDPGGPIWGVVLNDDQRDPNGPTLMATAAERDEELLSLAHDLRGPLNAILGFSDVLRHADAQSTIDPVRSAGRHITAAGERLLLGLDGMFDLARLRLNRMPLHPVSLQPDALWMQVQELMSAELELREVRLDAEGPAAGSAPAICSDPGRIQQLMAQALSSVLSACKPGQRLLVRWNVAAERGTWQWQLEGPCPPDFVPGGKGSHAMAYEVCKRLAQRLGGQFRIRSGPDAGACVEFELPTSWEAAN